MGGTGGESANKGDIQRGFLQLYLFCRRGNIKNDKYPTQHPHRYMYTSTLISTTFKCPPERTPAHGRGIYSVLYSNIHRGGSRRVFSTGSLQHEISASNKFLTFVSKEETVFGCISILVHVVFGPGSTYVT